MFTFFYYIWGFVNYATHLDIQKNTIDHPEFVPKSSTVKLSSAWYENLVSDFYWLSAIQYIWNNALDSQYKKYLYVLLNLVTDLNPHFTYPYEIWELLLSSSNDKYEKFTKEETKKAEEQALKIWFKWMSNTCDLNKVELIKKEYNLWKLWTDPKYKNPCSDPMIPYYIAYTYYWNKNDPVKSWEYYRITSANEESVSWARIMAAIMQWKSWDRQKSILMFLSLAESLNSKNSKSCQQFSQELWTLLFRAFSNWQIYNWTFLKSVESTRKDIIKKLWENMTEGLADNTCSNYLNKAVREMNMAFIENADIKYFSDKKKHARSAKVLFDEWYIDFLPLDFQQEKDYWIIYFYNDTISHWDYKMWKYSEL